MNKKNLLNTINSPSDIKSLSNTKLQMLCSEIRGELISTVSKTGGHLASNLGTVELTVALHKIFDTPKDQIVWDVGHQSYTHKLLTGRREQFHTLRQENGIAGFPKTEESIHDAFISGHSSTSISVAHGLATAKRASGEDGHVIAVMGDGAFTGGLAYEGLNNSARRNEKLIIILNDNNMSISKNVGGMAKYLAVIRSKPEYFRLKDAVEKTVRNTPIIGDKLYGTISNSKTFFKQALYNSSNIFESLGYTYLGPIDGHNIESLCDVLERAKSLNSPTVVHIETKKGNGYSFAEKNPDTFHGISKFDVETGHPDVITKDSFSSIFGDELLNIARENPKVCAVTAAMGQSTGLRQFAIEFKRQYRYFDVGIAEAHAVTFSAALSANGMIPVFAVYSTFLQRAFDQVIHDASIEKRHMVLAIDRSGIVGDDGETHQGVFDVPMLSMIPNIVIYSPSNYNTLRNCLRAAINKHDGVVAVRYPRGCEPEIPEAYKSDDVNYSYHSSGDEKTLLVTYGRLFGEAIKARETLAAMGTDIAILNLTKIMPIADKAFEIARDYKNIIFLEESMKTGGIGEHFLFTLYESGYHGKTKLKAIDNKFVSQASVSSAIRKLELDSQSIINMVLGE